MSKGDKAEREHQFRAGDVILAKIKGFPAWPGILVDDADVPREAVSYTHLRAHET